MCTPSEPRVQQLVAPGSGGGPPWDGARLLAGFLLSPAGAGLLTGTSVLELGAGSHGLPSCAAASAGASLVVATDRATVLPSLAAALGGQLGSPTLRAAALEWGGNLQRALGRALGSPGAFDWVILSELFSLSPSLFPALLKTVRDAAPRRGLLCAFRPREGFEFGFFDSLQAEGWRVREACRGVHGAGGFVCTEDAALEACDALVFIAERGGGG